MKEELIKFETAKLAKEKGFDWECRGRYGETLGQWVVTYPQTRFSFWYDNDILAPTQSLLQRWLREVHKIHITITSISQESWQYHITKVGDSLGKLYNEDYDDYEEALEDALVDALNLIP